MSNKSDAIPLRLEAWELKAIREISDIEGLNRSETLRIIIRVGIEHFHEHPELLATAYLKYKREMKALKATPAPAPPDPKTIGRGRAKSAAQRILHKKQTAA